MQKVWRGKLHLDVRAAKSCFRVACTEGWEESGASVQSTTVRLSLHLLLTCSLSVIDFIYPMPTATRLWLPYLLVQKCLCARACVCVWEREKQREIEREETSAQRIRYSGPK